MIYGFDYPAWPMDPVIEAFEMLASARVTLSARSEAAFSISCIPCISVVGYSDGR